MDHASIKIDIGPAQSPYFAQAHSGEDRGDDERTPPGRGVVDQEIEFGHRREINACPNGTTGSFPVVCLDANGPGNILGNQAAPLRERKHSFEAGNDLAAHDDGSAILA
ncbi:MAG: hypothetical protein WCD65_16965 [Pseudolabrys sp.]|jgi:hypothetical protein